MLENTKTSKGLQIIPRASLKCGKGQPEFLNTSEKALIKNFADHPVLNNFFEENSGLLSVQWVKIGEQDKVEIHDHEVDTLMISCVGECLLIGEMRKVLQEGDIVFIPKYYKHGLLPHNSKLFWGLSLRFYATVHH